MTDTENQNQLDELIKAAEKNESAAAEEVHEAAKDDGLKEDLFNALKMAQSVGRGGVWWLSDEDFERQWGDRTLRGIAQPGAEIMHRHGWDVAGVMGRYGPYIALLAAVAPPTIATVQAYKTATRAEAQQPSSPEKKHETEAG